MYQDRIEITFDAGHRLLKYKGKCEVPHGHTFKIEIMVKSEILDNLGFVVDFVQLRKNIGNWIDENWDHAFLVNSKDQELLHSFSLLTEKKLFIFEDCNPTAEVMAKYLFNIVLNIYGNIVAKVRVWESPNQYAEYSETL